MGNWNTISTGGSGTAPTVPDAPNVLNTSGHLTTVAVIYDCPNNDSVYAFQCSISLDITNPNIGYLRKLHILNSVTGREVLGSPILQPVGGWSTSPIAFTSEQYPQLLDGLSHSGNLTFEVENDDGIISASPVSVAYTIQASKVTGFASAGETGTRTPDANGVVYCTPAFVPNINGNQVPQNITLVYSKDNGANWTYVGWDKMLAVGQSYKISQPVPASTQIWKFAARTGAWPGNPNVPIPNANLDAAFMPSSGFTINGLAAPAPNRVTGISAGTILAQKDITSGWQYAELTGISWTDPLDSSTPAGTDPPWLIKFYARNTDSAGNPAPITSTDKAGAWKEWFEKQVIRPGGTSRTSDPGPWPLGDAMAIAYRTDAYHYIQLQCVAVNRLSTSPADWNGTNTASSISQGSVIQIDFGASPPSKATPQFVTMNGADVTSIPGPSNAGMALSCPIGNGAALSSNVATYCWDGTVTLPTDTTTYAGSEVTVQYAGSVEGGAFAKLGPTQTTFHNGDWPRPATSIAVTFRAYPISRDGVRGTPVTYSTTIGASSSYTPPVVPAPPGSITGFAMSFLATDSAPNGAAMFKWRGSYTLPADLTNYNGAHITQQWPGETESPVGDLDANATAFSNGPFPRPLAATTVIFRVYPISRDNQRGTPTQAPLSIPIAASPDPANMLANWSFEEDATYGGISAPVSGWTLTGYWQQWLNYSRSGVGGLRVQGSFEGRQFFGTAAGRSYYLEAWFSSYSDTTYQGTAYLYVEFYDRAGALIGSATLLGTTPMASYFDWTRLKGTVVAPANAAKLAFLVRAAGAVSSSFYIDDCLLKTQLSTGPGATGDDNGGVRGGTGNPATSLLNDWDFNLSKVGPLSTGITTQWGWGGPSVNIQNDNDGVGNYVRLIGNGSNVQQMFAVAGGQKLAWTAWMRHGLYGNANGNIYIWWYDGNKALIGSPSTIYTFGGTNVAAGAWGQGGVTFNITPPANATYALIQVILSDASSNWDITKFILRPNYTLN